MIKNAPWIWPHVVRLRYLLPWNLIWLVYLNWIKTVLQYIWASSVATFCEVKPKFRKGCHIFLQFVDISVEILVHWPSSRCENIKALSRDMKNSYKRERACEQEPLVYLEFCNALNPWGSYSRLVRHLFKQFTSCWCIAEEKSLPLRWWGGKGRITQPKK